MFNTNLEVSKFIGGKIQTVSGIRGSIKKHEGKYGNFRATFEDRLLKSDIIFMKTWVRIHPKKFYNPVRSLLLRDKENWQGMRTRGELRFLLNKKANPAQFKSDSIYRFSGRKKIRSFNSLKISENLSKNLPYHLRPKLHPRKRMKGDNASIHFANKEERRLQDMVTSLSHIAKNHLEREKETKRTRRGKKRKLKLNKEKGQRLAKRRRIQRHMTGHDKKNDFEATRGNKFHKEWRLNKR